MLRMIRKGLVYYQEFIIYIYTEMLLWMVIPTVVPFIFVKAVPSLDCVAAVPYQFIKLGYITGYN